jgi:hypothetical protein
VTKAKPVTELQRACLDYLEATGVEVERRQIANAVGRQDWAVEGALGGLMRRGLVRKRVTSFGAPYLWEAV